ncbi:MAG: hypothetical protein HKN47_13920 [Pirellulaceae bacterium]|nr:hypothetical protein [Pirellulaceae bacterium]
MTDLLAEQPLLTSLMVGLVAAALLYGWLQSGKKPLAAAGFLMALMIPVIWVIAGEWETDREQIEAAIVATAAAVEANDHELAVEFIGDKETRQQALAELPKYVFDRVKVSGVSINIDPNSRPPQADVDMTASVNASDKRGQFQNMRVPRRVLLTFEKNTAGRWVVVDYNHMPIGGRPDAFSPPQVIRQ